MKREGSLEQNTDFSVLFLTTLLRYITYNQLHPFKVYNSVSFDKIVYTYEATMNIQEHFCCPQNFSGPIFSPSLAPHLAMGNYCQLSPTTTD